ncbi:MAG TPA: UDP-N-acetylmuramate dehydrogenase [Clostridiales bacterium]|nr:UDP-N-acetylmuramate dehydrogenase [Clostridiales bacterium]
MEEVFYNKLIEILNDKQIFLKESMENHTTLHIGGQADYLVTPSSMDEIMKVIDLCKSSHMPYYIMGNGSNLLVSDDGYRGLIMKIGDNYSELSISEDGTVLAQGGILLSKLANAIAKESLTGFEFASGIPGTLGGAVYMNAGAYGGEMVQCLVNAKVMDMDGEIFILSSKELELGYRTSILQKKDYILLEATMKFNKGNKEEIFGQMQEFNRRRRDKQPLDKYSAGSTFKRPVGHFAGKLISDAGLSGFQIGGAAVSDKHCGFLINKDNATAKDFATLIQEVIRIVHERDNVTLEPEVRFLGDF